ncbi:thiolase family protein [Mycobacterium sp. GA-2829]|uniref:thiolase family protein n=1 Tax=Mycobacterium sp. GA-2829 TaxID=1772283 RepID=UPI0007404926|nr:thiolase family protein [Mycobacterium sp. GA-2829]KUI36467.1 acetyl-CoA acetyltransferase [Mycobacterium sp. GA-2829]
MSVDDHAARDALIVGCVRSAIGRGKAGGALSEVHPADLLAQVLRGLLDQFPSVDPGAVQDVIVGCVTQGSEQSGTPGRMAWLSAGYPEHVPSVTIDRKCSSSQEAIHLASYQIACGAADIVIAAGVESMSRVPMGSSRAGGDFSGPGVRNRYAPGLIPQGVGAELVATRYGLSRRDLDEYSAESHRRAAAAREQGLFGREIVAVTTPGGVVEADETIRPQTTVERLADLKVAFDTDTYRQRFPEQDWKVTAGNSSQISDGASAVLMMSARAADALGVQPRARIVATAAVGDDPLLMLTGPIPATRKIFENSGLDLADIGHIELNEAFASVPLAWHSEFKFDADKLNPRGGAIALGHPLGASGARLMTTMVHGLEDNDQQFGLQLMCAAGGMATATIIERV